MWDEQKLTERIISDESDFFPDSPKDGTLVDLGQGSYYIYKDRKARILGVAHLDTVSHDPGGLKIVDLKGNKLIRSIMLDDRLGVHILMDVLPKLGIKFDLLLTTGEEKGMSSAEDFKPPDGKEYNWIFSFDRHGKGCVMYDYETPKYIQYVRDAGFRYEQGTFSDICWLSHLGVAGFNFGTGYNQEHTNQCFAMWDVVRRQVKRFLRFYTNHSSTKMINTNPVGIPGDWYSYYSRPVETSSAWMRSRIDADYDKLSDDYEKAYKDQQRQLNTDFSHRDWSWTRENGILRPSRSISDEEIAAEDRLRGELFPKDTALALPYLVDGSYDGAMFSDGEICPVCGSAILPEDYQYGDGMCRWCWDSIQVKIYSGRNGDEWD